MKPEIRHAWNEPVRGAMIDWFRTWYFKVVWLVGVAAVVAAIAVERNHGGASEFRRVFLRIAGLLVFPFILYAFVNRQVWLYDDGITIRHGRGGSTYPLKNIAQVDFDLTKRYPSITIALVTGKQIQVLLDQGHLAANVIRDFLVSRGVRCEESS